MNKAKYYGTPFRRDKEFRRVLVSNWLRFLLICAVIGFYVCLIDISRSAPQSDARVYAVDKSQDAVEGNDRDSDSSNNNESANVPSISPVEGRLADDFGSRRNPFNAQNKEFHAGLDIAAPIGATVSATADGVVTFAGWKNGYGNVVIVNHGNGISTRFAHLSGINVETERFVRRGDELGKVGSTGRSTGAHLHYEVRVDEKPVDPTEYLPSL